MKIKKFYMGNLDIASKNEWGKNIKKKFSGVPGYFKKEQENPLPKEVQDLDMAMKSLFENLDGFDNIFKEAGVSEEETEEISKDVKRVQDEVYTQVIEGVAGAASILHEEDGPISKKIEMLSSIIEAIFKESIEDFEMPKEIFIYKEGKTEQVDLNVFLASMLKNAPTESLTNSRDLFIFLKDSAILDDLITQILYANTDVFDSIDNQADLTNLAKKEIGDFQFFSTKIKIAKLIGNLSIGGSMSVLHSHFWNYVILNGKVDLASIDLVQVFTPFWGAIENYDHYFGLIDDFYATGDITLALQALSVIALGTGIPALGLILTNMLINKVMDHIAENPDSTIARALGEEKLLYKSVIIGWAITAYGGADGIFTGLASEVAKDDKRTEIFMQVKETYTKADETLKKLGGYVRLTERGLYDIVVKEISDGKGETENGKKKITPKGAGPIAGGKWTLAERYLDNGSADEFYWNAQRVTGVNLKEVNDKWRNDGEKHEFKYLNTIENGGGYVLEDKEKGDGKEMKKIDEIPSSNEINKNSNKIENYNSQLQEIMQELEQVLHVNFSKDQAKKLTKQEFSEISIHNATQVIEKFNVLMKKIELDSSQNDSDGVDSLAENIVNLVDVINTELDEINDYAADEYEIKDRSNLAVDKFPELENVTLKLVKLVDHYSISNKLSMFAGDYWKESFLGAGISVLFEALTAMLALLLISTTKKRENKDMHKIRALTKKYIPLLQEGSKKVVLNLKRAGFDFEHFSEWLKQRAQAEKALEALPVNSQIDNNGDAYAEMSYTDNIQTYEQGNITDFEKDDSIWFHSFTSDDKEFAVLHKKEGGIKIVPTENVESILATGNFEKVVIVSLQEEKQFTDYLINHPSASFAHKIEELYPDLSREEQKQIALEKQGGFSIKGAECIAPNLIGQENGSKENPQKNFGIFIDKGVTYLTDYTGKKILQRIA